MRKYSIMTWLLAISFISGCGKNVYRIKNAKNSDEMYDACKAQQSAFRGSREQVRKDALRLAKAILEELKTDYRNGYQYLTASEKMNLQNCALSNGNGVEAFRHALELEMNNADINDKSEREWLLSEHSVWANLNQDDSFFYLINNKAEISRKMNVQAAVLKEQEKQQRELFAKQDAELAILRQKHQKQQVKNRQDCLNNKGKGNRIYEAKLAQLPDMANICQPGTIAVCNGSRQNVVDCPYGVDANNKYLTGKIELYYVQFICTLVTGEEFINTTGYFQNSRGQISKTSVPCTP